MQRWASTHLSASTLLAVFVALEALSVLKFESGSALAALSNLSNGTEMYIYVAISNRQQNMEAQALLLNPFQHLLIMQTEVFSFVRLLTKKQSYPFSNGPNLTD